MKLHCWGRRGQVDKLQDTLGVLLELLLRAEPSTSMMAKEVTLSGAVSSMPWCWCHISCSIRAETSRSAPASASGVSLYNTMESTMTNETEEVGMALQLRGL